MAKTYEFEDKTRTDIPKKPLTEEEAGGKMVLVSEPEITPITLVELRYIIQEAEERKAQYQKEIDDSLAQITEIKAALNIT